MAEEKTAALMRHGDGTESFTPATVNAETLAKREQSLLQGKLWAARQFPRNIETVETRLLHECKRPRLAEIARYSLPRGEKKVEGWTIRFAEQAMRLFGNVEVRTLIISEDRDLRVIEVQIVDYETMVSESRQLTVSKTIERKQLKRGDEPVAERKNVTTGEVIYVVPATEADMLAKQNGIISRSKRNLILELMPPDVLYACERQVLATITDTAKSDPDASKRRMLEKFAEIGVTPAQLQVYLGFPIADLANKLISGNKAAELLSLYEAIKGGETSWAQVMEGKNTPSESSAPPVPKKTPPPPTEAKPESKPEATKRTEPVRMITAAAGTKEHAEQVMAAMRACTTREELNSIAPAGSKAHRDWKAGVDAIYAQCLDNLSNGGN